MNLHQAYHHYTQTGTVPDGLDEPSLAFLAAARPRSRVLINCSDNQLRSVVGAIILGLADHLDGKPEWKRLRFHINCTIIDNRKAVNYYSLSVWTGNNSEWVNTIKERGGVVLLSRPQDELEDDSYELSDPDSIGQIYAQIDTYIDHIIRDKKSTGWEEFE